MLKRRSVLELGAAWLPLRAAASESGKSSNFQSVRALGAQGDAKTKDTEAIQKAIDSMNAAGGGTAYVPPGTYLTGGIELKSNVTLLLEAGAILLGSTDLNDYRSLPGPNPKGDANNKHLIFARGAENIALAGLGVIDGQGPKFWANKHRAPVPPEDLWKDVATYDWAPLRRPSPMVELVECKNVHVGTITLRNSPGWTFRPVNCDSVFVNGLTIRNPVIGPNTDGIDPTGCHDVFISNCDIATGDDTICLKSENPYGGEVRVSRNITITNCVLTGCCNGFKMGTGTQGGFENITFSNSVIYNEDVPLNARVIAGIALEIVDGGWVDGILISNIRMQNVRTPIFVRLGDRSHRNGHVSRLKGVTISDVQATGAILTSSITGIPDHLVEDVTLRGIRISTVEGGKKEWGAEPVSEQINKYPEARMFGRLPAFGLYCRHAKGLRFSDIQIDSEVPDPRPLLACDDIEDLVIDGLRGKAQSPQETQLHLHNVRNAFIRGSIAAEQTASYITVAGAQSKNITLMGNDLSGAQKVAEAAPDTPENTVFLLGNRTKAV
ncbi:MAG TPA: glycosyl hydrolase family 28 protein [Bryobacteraceae bacterium]|jgi:polygalacturonase